MSEQTDVLRTEAGRTEFRFADEQQREIELIETTELPVVAQASHVVEEVRVKKELVERTADVHATVRHTEVDVVPLATEDGWTRRSE